jgi:sigma-B regulation protein RsbU (phosphoserine phosphatase)
MGQAGRVSSDEMPGASDEIAERLANLRALTDSALTHLDVDDLLIELLSRVREILDVDTAAVLFLDKGTGELEARAACGIEDEVRQGVRVPLGVGFAGRIAATREVVRLDRVDSTTVANPLLWERGISVMLGVPLLASNSVLGVLHVGRLERRPFTDHDVELLQVVADRVSAAVETRQHAVERAAAVLLERSLLPPRRPNVPGLGFATRYVAAEERTVGGDWYDFFILPSGQLWIVVGDVAGHGLAAAVVMGRIRSALRAYSMVEPLPERVLDLVDRKVSHFEIGTFATVACAVMDPPYDTMTVAVAGHPLPVVAEPGRPAYFVDVEISPPVGTNLASRPRSSTTLTLAPGAVVALYTDGLVERRGESLDVGFERLRTATAVGPPDVVAREIMHQLVGGIVPRDDIALVVVARTGAPNEN